MDAAPAQHLHGRGAPRLLEPCAVLERVTRGERPSARARLELELGGELAGLLVAALAGASPSRRAPGPA